MAEWIHKEDHWQEARIEYHNGETCNGWRVKDGVPTFITYNMDIEELNESGYLNFTDWLDLLCSGGWEVLNISRYKDDTFDYRITWVVFRKQV